MQPPIATQGLTKSGQIQRRAACPEHGFKSSQFIGGQMPLLEGGIMWAFRCKSAGGHVFLAYPDPSAPKSVEELEAWKVLQTGG